MMLFRGIRCVPLCASPATYLLEIIRRGRRRPLARRLVCVVKTSSGRFCMCRYERFGGGMIRCYRRRISFEARCVEYSFYRTLSNEFPSFAVFPRVAPCVWTVRSSCQGSPLRSDKRTLRALDSADGQALCLAMRAFASCASQPW